MMTKTSKTAAKASPAKASPAAAPVAKGKRSPLGENLQEFATLAKGMIEATANNPACSAKNRTPRGAASKASQKLNALGWECPGNPYWTTDRLTAFLAKHAS
jgi:hypothetical protein